jgi:aspartate aminotransferase
MAIARSIIHAIENSSWIRKMFEEGAELKNKFGAENVFDFSLGNPDVEPPTEFFEALKGLSNNRQAGVHGYMPNAGYTDVRTSIAARVSADHNAKLQFNHIIMTCGAAGGLNIIFKTILDPDDEVIVPTPYFVEYGFYTGNHGGKLVPVESNEDFSLNIQAIDKAITDKTKAVLINSPNNPTGKIYKEDEIKNLSKLLLSHCNGSKVIYLISDEPYREIVYDNIIVPSILLHYPHSIIATSYSKTLSIPGERIGYVAVNPKCDKIEQLMAGMILSNRILGFVNAPAIMQRIVAALNNVAVDVDTYKKRRDMLVEGLKSAGYEFSMPEGAFYIFCKSPLKDEIEFIKHLLKYNVLVVPGRGFGSPGYFRIAYCVSENVIAHAIPKFKQAIDDLK